MRSRGFTLLEMLVTLVIVSLTIGILSESLFQLNRLERLLAGGQLQAQTEVIRMQWVRQSLSSLQTGDASGRGRFSGNPRELSGVTGNPLTAGGGGYGALKLTLAFDAASGQTVLWSDDPGTAPPVALLRWPGDVGRWLYIDRQGNPRETWPPPSGEQRQLPAAVALFVGPDRLPAVFVEVLADDNPMPTRREYEAM